MEADRERAYRLLISAVFLHVKWDLSCMYGRVSWSPWRLRHQYRNARRAAYRVATFHNLAIFSTWNFERFSEERFWREVDQFLHDFPESNWSNYRGMFEASLRGEPVNVIQPGGVVPAPTDLAVETL